MKQLIILLLTTFTAMSINAQIMVRDKTELSKKATNKLLTINTTAAQTVKSPASTTLPVSSPTEKLIDLILTDATITATQTGTDTYKLEINYTIMNIDTAAIPLGIFGLQGAIAVEGNGLPFSAGCGTTAGLSYVMLNSGNKVSGTYFCFNKKLIGNGRLVYDVSITANPGFKIADQNRAGRRIYFTR